MHSSQSPNTAPQPFPLDDTFVADYTTWVSDVWGGDPSPETLSARSHSWSVCGLGLMGEIGEMLDEVERWQKDGQHFHDMISEAGDVLYYWTRLSLLAGHRPSFDRPSQNISSVDTSATVAQLWRAGSRCSELVKKYVRNGDLRHKELEDGLAAFGDHFFNLLQVLNLSPRDVAAANREKIEKRIQDNIHAGDGDFRLPGYRKAKP